MYYNYHKKTTILFEKQRLFGYLFEFFLGIYCNFNKQYYEKNKALYEIYITNDQIIKLIELGLNTHRLQINKLTKSSKNYEKKLQLKSVEHYGYADVYCVTTLDDSHKAVFNGILSHNCGEQTLHDFELCNLVEIFINRSEGYDDFIDTLKYAFMYAKIVSLCETQWEDTNKIIILKVIVDLKLSVFASIYLVLL